MHILTKIVRTLIQTTPMFKKVLAILSLSILTLNLCAQEQDLGLRSELGLRYRLNKKSSLDFSYRLDLKENISQFRRSNFSFAYNRKINKWLDAELYYRFITNNTQDKHRFRVALSTDKKIYKRTKLEFRTLLQHDLNYLDGDYLRSYKPRWVWRNRLRIDYKINKRWSADVYTEPFISQNYKGFNPYRIRTGASLAYTKKRWKLSAEYFYQSEFYFEQSGLNVIGVGARYDITRLIRPKKKKGKKAKKKGGN